MGRLIHCIRCGEPMMGVSGVVNHRCKDSYKAYAGFTIAFKRLCDTLHIVANLRRHNQ